MDSFRKHFPGGGLIELHILVSRISMDVIGPRKLLQYNPVRQNDFVFAAIDRNRPESDVAVLDRSALGVEMH